MRAGIPVCPGHLDVEAKAEWFRIVPELQAAKLLKLVDRAALAAYCQLWSRWVMAEGVIAEKGMTYDANGLLKVNPAVRIAQDSLSMMKSYLVEFGFTPASRSRVGPGAPAVDEEQAELDALLTGNSFGGGVAGEA